MKNEITVNEILIARKLAFLELMKNDKDFEQHEAWSLIVDLLDRELAKCMK